MRVVGMLIALLLIVSCDSVAQKESQNTTPKIIGMPNPASVKCHEDGHKLEIRKDPQGNEYGICIDTQGKECDEWAYFRGECKLSKGLPR